MLLVERNTRAEGEKKIFAQDKATMKKMECNNDNGNEEEMREREKRSVSPSDKRYHKRDAERRSLKIIVIHATTRA